MTRDQRTVAVGAASGILGMLLMVWGFSTLIDTPAVTGTSDRLAYALRWAVVAALPFFFMIAAVGNARFASDAIDPTLGKESEKMVVDGRVADNTLQQLVLFLIGMMATTGLPAIACSSASRWSGRSGPGSITATRVSPIRYVCVP